MPKRHSRKRDEPTIGQFVEEVAKGGVWSDDFERFPRRTMKRYGLSDENIEKVMDGEIGPLRRQIERDLNAKPLVFRVKRGS